MVQWFGLCVSNAGHMGSAPSQGTKIQHGKKKKVRTIRIIYFKKLKGIKVLSNFLEQRDI